MVDGEGETVLEAQDHDANEVLDTDGVKLTYRYLKAIQHADDDFGNRKAQAAVHYECFVTSKVTRRGTISALSETRNPKFHRIRNSVNTVRRKSLVLLLGAPSSIERWFMTGNDFSLGGVIEPYLAVHHASFSAGSTE